METGVWQALRNVEIIDLFLILADLRWHGFGMSTSLASVGTPQLAVELETSLLTLCVSNGRHCH